MRVTEARLEYGRTVSDGNYGSERVVVAVTATVEPTDQPGDVLAALYDLARGDVLGRLRASENPTVRLGVGGPLVLDPFREEGE